MRFIRAIGFACAIVAVGLALAPGASSHSAAVGCKPEAGMQIASTRDHRYTLLVGNVENMYMPRQVRANHLKHGEEMLRGNMTPVAMLTGGPIRHLEVQICVRTTQAVVTNAHPRIVVKDTTKDKSVMLPFSVMVGVGEGIADLHYGNNLAMPAGHRFIITVTWRGERAAFHYVSPRASH